jgi:hypothetical protein
MVRHPTKRTQKSLQSKNFGKIEKRILERLKKLISSNSKTHLPIFWHLKKTTFTRIKLQAPPQYEVEGHGKKKSRT